LRILRFYKRNTKASSDEDIIKECLAAVDRKRISEISWEKI